MYIDEYEELLESAKTTTSQRMYEVSIEYEEKIAKARAIIREARNSPKSFSERSLELKELLEEAIQLNMYYDNLRREYYSLFD